MIKLLIRADDIGYCDGVNRGIRDVVETGLVKSAGLMPNMEEAQKGFEMLKELDVCIGQHTNLCLDKPCCNPDDIPSLVNEDGLFKSSKQYRDAFKEGLDIINVDDAIKEIDAQYKRFKEITNREPAYFEAHALASNNLRIALSIVAKENNLLYSDMFPMQKNATYNGKKVIQCNMNSMNEDYNPLISLQEAISCADLYIPNIYVLHPGYVDEYLLENSSLTYNREKEVSMMRDENTAKYLKQQNIKVISYLDIK